MQSLFCTLLLFAVLTSSFATFVFDLDSNTFDHYLREKDVMLVDFFAPWCTHCKNLAPELENAANTLATKNQFVFGKVDCIAPQNEALCKKFDIQGYPSLKLFKFGQYSGDYIGGRNTNDLLTYMESVTEASAQRAPLTTNGPASFAASLGANPQALINPLQLQYQPGLQPQPFQVPQQGQAYFNSPFTGQAPGPGPSLVHSFYNANPPNNNPGVASFSQANQPKVEAKVVGPSHDSPTTKFGGNMLALDILRSKLKMIAAYKNWQKRLKEYKEKMTDAAKMNPYNQNKGFAKQVIHRPNPAAVLKARALLRKSKSNRFQKKFPRTYRTPLYRPRPALRPAYRPAPFRRGSIYGRPAYRPQSRAHQQRTQAYRQPFSAAYKRYFIFKQRQRQKLQQQRQKLQQQRQKLQQQRRRQQIQQQQQQQQRGYQQAYGRSSIARPPQATQGVSDAALQREEDQADKATVIQNAEPQDTSAKIAQPETQDSTGKSQGQVTIVAPKQQEAQTPSSDTDTSIKNLKEDIESAIKDALKTANVNSKGAKAKTIPTVGSKTLDVSGSGSGNDESSGSGESHARHLADMTGIGSGSKPVTSGSGSGDNTSKKTNDKTSGEA